MRNRAPLASQRMAAAEHEPTARRRATAGEAVHSGTAARWSGTARATPRAVDAPTVCLPPLLAMKQRDPDAPRDATRYGMTRRGTAILMRHDASHALDSNSHLEQRLGDVREAARGGDVQRRVAVRERGLAHEGDGTYMWLTGCPLKPWRHPLDIIQACRTKQCVSLAAFESAAADDGGRGRRSLAPPSRRAARSSSSSSSRRAHGERAESSASSTSLERRRVASRVWLSNALRVTAPRRRAARRARAWRCRAAQGRSPRRE